MTWREEKKKVQALLQNEGSAARKRLNKLIEYGIKEAEMAAYFYGVGREPMNLGAISEKFGLESRSDVSAKVRAAAHIVTGGEIPISGVSEAPKAKIQRAEKEMLQKIFEAKYREGFLKQYGFPPLSDNPREHSSPYLDILDYYRAGLFEHLNETERFIVELRYGMNSEGIRKNNEEIAEDLDKTREYVRKVFSAATGKLRQLYDALMRDLNQNHRRSEGIAC